ncbi:hypothetical protein ACQPYK_20265 [Streptosporangium sp. CA-135522]|uniref:hypothetical protein n=1 Tax=Streptosporangium sp. CA-135522 TaxID=3240072 RepID=UPI003D90B339
MQVVIMSGRASRAMYRIACRSRPAVAFTLPLVGGNVKAAMYAITVSYPAHQPVSAARRPSGSSPASNTW